MVKISEYVGLNLCWQKVEMLAESPVAAAR